MEEKRIHVSPEKRIPLLCGSCSFKSSYDFSLTTEDLEKANLELRETVDARATAVRDLKEKISRGDQDFKYRTDDSYLIRFLRHCKFDVEKTYNLLGKFYVYRHKHPHVFSLSHLELLLNVRLITFLPYADEEGCIVFWIDFRNWKADELDIWNIASVYHVLADLITENPNVQIKGVKGLWDMRGISLRHIAQVFNPVTIVFLVKMLQEIYPLKLKKVVAVHSSYLFRATYNTVRHLLKKKLQDRMVLLGSTMSELHKYFHPAILPKDYGGTLQEHECYVTRHVMENMNYLKYERSFGLI